MVSLSKYLGYSQSHKCEVHYSTGRVGWLSALFVHSGEVVTVLCTWLVMKLSTGTRPTQNSRFRRTCHVLVYQLSILASPLAGFHCSLIVMSVSMTTDSILVLASMGPPRRLSASKTSLSRATATANSTTYLLPIVSLSKRETPHFISRSRCMLQWLLQVLIPCHFRFGCKDLKDRFSYQHEQSSSY